MLIENIPEMHLSDADDREIAALLARCFSSDFGGKSFFIQRHHLRLVVRDSGKIIGHMAVMLRAVQLGDDLLTIAGLAEVATDPDHRGKGIAAALLQAAITEAKLSPAIFLLLFGEAKLYAAAGFQNVSNKMAHHAAKANRLGRVVTKGNDHLMVLPLRDKAWPKDLRLDLRGPVF